MKTSDKKDGEAQGPDQGREGAAARSREALLALRDGKIEARGKELRDREQVLAKKEAELSERGLAVKRRELEAEAGFATARRDMLCGLEQEHAKLRESMVELSTRYVRERHARFEALDREIEEATATRRKALAAELTQRRMQAEADLKEQIERQQTTAEHEIEARQKEWEDRWAELDTRTGSIEYQEMELLQKRKELERERLSVRAERDLLKDEREMLVQRGRDRAAEEVGELRSQLEQAKRRIEKLQGEQGPLEQRMERYEDFCRRFRDTTPEEVLRRQGELREEIGRLENELLARPPAELKRQLEQVRDDRDALCMQSASQQREIRDLNKELANYRISVGNFEQERERKEAAEYRQQVLGETVESLKEQLAATREQPPDEESRIGAIREPYFGEGERTPKQRDCSEIKWLDRIRDRSIESGLVFDRRLLFAFHTALKTAEWSPLTVLGGVSGTGKSELPRIYSYYGGLLFLPLAVQPDWDSPQSLFGFFNSVDNRFNAEPLLRVLVQAEHDRNARDYEGGCGDCMVLVLLDEMNLAHVELYFSDLLSKLELRRGRDRAEPLQIDLGAGLKKFDVGLDRNVLWAGTMNEDETTKALSDKVLDRSNLIYFPRPVELARRSKTMLKAQAKALPGTRWEAWLKAAVLFEEERVAPFKQVIEDINDKLEKVGRAVGHRVWQSIEHYMANHPDVIAAKPPKDDQALQAAMRTAFEDQIVQKVMPKLRGIETEGHAATECLNPIKELLVDAELNLAEDFDLAMTAGYGEFVWRSARYLGGSQSDGAS